jgi:hypothetical protein
VLLFTFLSLLWYVLIYYVIIILRLRPSLFIYANLPYSHSALHLSDLPLVLLLTIFTPVFRLTYYATPTLTLRAYHYLYLFSYLHSIYSSLRLLTLRASLNLTCFILIYSALTTLILRPSPSTSLLSSLYFSIQLFLYLHYVLTLTLLYPMFLTTYSVLIILTLRA